MAGISGGEREGADSIVVSGGYEDDEDYGDVIVYTGAGGNDPDREAVQPLSPATVEAIRRALLEPPRREVAAARLGQRDRRRYELPAPGTPQTRRRDALIVSLLAYAGLRPGELRALRLGDVRDKTIFVQRAANPDGSIKGTKNERHRAVRLLSPLAQDLREYGLASGRPPDRALVLSATAASRGTRRPGGCGASAAGLQRVPRRGPSIPFPGRMTCATASPRCCWPKESSRSTSPASSATRSPYYSPPTRT
jgi:integrase